MMFWIQTLLTLIFFFIPLNIPVATNSSFPFLIDNVPVRFPILQKGMQSESMYFLDSSSPQSTGYEENAFSIVVNNHPSTPRFFPLAFPFIDDSRKGMIVNYDKNGNFLLFIDGQLIKLSQEDDHNDSLLPKIAYPFLLMFSKQRDFVKIYTIQDSQLQFQAQYVFSSIMTSYATSEDYRYLIIGTLSNELIIFDAQEQFQNPTVIHIKTPHIGIYGVGITAMGTYFALASYDPALFVYGDVEYPAKSSQIALPINISAHTQSLLRSENFVFIAGQNDLQVLQTSGGKNFSEFSAQNLRPYTLIEAKSIDKKRIALLYRLSEKEYIVDILDFRTWKFIHKFHIMTSSIPTFISIPIDGQDLPAIVSSTQGWVL